MSALTVNLPDNLHEKARQVAASKNLSMDAFVAMALSQSLSRLVADPYLEERASRATGKGIDEFYEAGSRDRIARMGSLAGGL